jgi:hypothetical protein
MFLDDSRIDRAKKVRDELYADMVKNEVTGENIPQRQPFDVDLNGASLLSGLRLPITE